MLVPLRLFFEWVHTHKNHVVPLLRSEYILNFKLYQIQAKLYYVHMYQVKLILLWIYIFYLIYNSDCIYICPALFLECIGHVILDRMIHNFCIRMEIYFCHKIFYLLGRIHAYAKFAYIFHAKFTRVGVKQRPSANKLLVLAMLAESGKFRGWLSFHISFWIKDKKAAILTPTLLLSWRDLFFG